MSSNWWSAGLDTSDLERDTERAKKMIADMNRSVISQGQQLDIAFRGIKQTIVGVFTIQAAQSFVSDIVRIRSEFQSLSVSFSTMLGNKERADALMGQLVRTAAITPFSMQEIANGAKQLLAYQVSAEEVNDSLVRLGNIASGIGVPLSRLILVYGQVRAKGKLMGDDLRQFTEAGIPMVAELAKQFGVSEAAIGGMVSAGKIGFKDVQTVINNLTNSGGMFYNLMEEKSKTLEGQISNLGDSWDQMLNKLGQSSEGVISDAISGAAVLVDNYEAVGEAIAVLISMYGAYKAALLANMVIEEVTQVMLLQRKLATVELTTAQALAAAATTSWTAAMRALNASLLANPYVLVAAGVTALGYAIFKMATEESAHEKALRESNEQMDKARELRDQLTGSADKWISTIKSETSTIYEQIKAYNKLKEAVPSAIGSLTFDQVQKMGQKDLKMRISVALDSKEYADAEKKVTDLQRQINETRAESMASPDGDAIYNKRLERYNAALQVAKEQLEVIKQQRREAEIASLPEAERVKYYRTQIDNLQAQRSQIEKILESSKLVNGIWQDQFSFQANINALNAINSQIKAFQSKIATPTTGPTISQSVADIRKSIAESEAKIAKLRAPGAVADVEAIKKEEQALKDYKATLETLTGTTEKKKSTDQNAAIRLKQEYAAYRETLVQQAADRRRAEQDLESQTTQIRISAMKDGTEKTLAQMQLDHFKEMQALDRQQEDLLQKHKNDAKAAFEANPANKKKVFNASSIVLTAEEEKNLSAIRIATQAKQLSDTENFYNNLYNKYQDYSTKRIAIEKQFNSDIDTLEKKRNDTSDENQRDVLTRSIAQATKEKGEALANLDYEQLKKTPEYVRAFENLKQTSGETLNSLLSQLENAKSTAAQVLSPDQLREYTGTIQQVMDELNVRNPFKALADRKNELAQAEEALAKAREILVAAQSGDDNGGTFDDEGNFISAAQAADKYRGALDKVTQKRAQVVSAQTAVNDALSKLAGSITELGGSIGGVTGEVIGLIGQVGQTVLSISTSITTVSAMAAGAVKTIETASIVLAVISAAYQIGSKIASLFTGKDKEQYESMKQNYESLIGVWDTLIGKKLEYLNTSTGQEAKKAEQEALDMLNKQVEATRQMALERLKVRNGGHSMEYRMWLGSYSFNGKTWDDVSTQITAATGKAVNSMRDFTNLSSDELKWIRENYVGLWSSMDDDFRKYLEQIIDYGDKVSDITKQTKESLTQITFDDVRNNFLDALSDMDSSSEDLANNVEKYLQKAILNSMMSEKYQEKLKEWYNSFAKANENGIDSSEYEKLKDEYNNIVNDAIAERDKLKDVFGWKGDDSGDSTTGVTGQLKDAMTEGTASQLVGLWNITAMDIRAIRDLLYSKLMEGSGGNGKPLDYWNDVVSLLDVTRQIQANTYRTANNTDNLVPTLNRMNDKLDDIVRNTRNNSSRG